MDVSLQRQIGSGMEFSAYIYEAILLPTKVHNSLRIQKNLGTSVVDTSLGVGLTCVVLAVVGRKASIFSDSGTKPLVALRVLLELRRPLV